MRFWKFMILFYFGGLCYLVLEFLWRGYSHWSMFLLGGSCFVTVGHLVKARPRLPLALRGLLAAVVITALELGCGILLNQSYLIWDYRHLPLNYHGQICLYFSLLWIPVSFAAMGLFRRADRFIQLSVGMNS